MAASSILSIFQNDKSIYIPSVNVLLEKPKLNPAYYTHVDAQLNEWCLKFLDLQDSTGFKARLVIESKFGILTAYVYPDISAAKLLAMAKLMCWIFFSDDVMDNPAVPTSDVKNATLVYKLIFGEEYEKAIALVKSSHLLRQVEMFRDVYTELLSFMNSHSKIRFKNSMIEVLDMFDIESSWVHKKLVPNMEFYMWLREMTIGAKPFFIAIDFLHGLELEEGTIGHPLIQDLELITTHHISLHNDIVSFKKEWTSQKKYINAVPLVAYTEGCGLNEAIAKVAAMVEDLEKEFTAVKEKISSSIDGIGLKKGVAEYVRGLENWAVANREWNWLTARYHGVGWVPGKQSGTFSLSV